MMQRRTRPRRHSVRLHNFESGLAQISLQSLRSPSLKITWKGVILKRSMCRKKQAASRLQQSETFSKINHRIRNMLRHLSGEDQIERFIPLADLSLISDQVIVRSRPSNVGTTVIAVRKKRAIGG